MKPQVAGLASATTCSIDAIVCGDSGTVTTWIARMQLRARQRFCFSGTMCSMMAALPYAIGAQAAYPDRQVVAFTGDGSLTMMMGDLATLVQEQLPVKVIVIKNNTLGLIKWEQMLSRQPGVRLSTSPMSTSSRSRRAAGCAASASRTRPAAATSSPQPSRSTGRR